VAVAGGRGKVWAKSCLLPLALSLKANTTRRPDTGSTAAQPALNQSFGYDELGRLTSITTAASSWTIGYDASGNRTSVTLNGSASTYTTPAASNRLASLTNPARSLTYDDAGNITADSAPTPGITPRQTDSRSSRRRSMHLAACLR
jgi:YD repeat-containing protein